MSEKIKFTQISDISDITDISDISDISEIMPWGGRGWYKMSVKEEKKMNRVRRMRVHEEDKKNQTHHGEFSFLWDKVFHFDFNWNCALHGDGRGAINLRATREMRGDK